MLSPDHLRLAALEISLRWLKTNGHNQAGKVWADGYSLTVSFSDIDQISRLSTD
jgi:hypothetical protein